MPNEAIEEKTVWEIFADQSKRKFATITAFIGVVIGIFYAQNRQFIPDEILSAIWVIYVFGFAAWFIGFVFGVIFLNTKKTGDDL
jgi:hypothetical protein